MVTLLAEGKLTDEQVRDAIKRADAWIAQARARLAQLESFRAVAKDGPKTFLGHSDENVTDTCIVPSLDEVRNAINRAARSIDGEAPAGAIPFPINPSQEPSHPLVSMSDVARGAS